MIYSWLINVIKFRIWWLTNIFTLIYCIFTYFFNWLKFKFLFLNRVRLWMWFFRFYWVLSWMNLKWSLFLLWRDLTWWHTFMWFFILLMTYLALRSFTHFFRHLILLKWLLRFVLLIIFDILWILWFLFIHTNDIGIFVVCHLFTPLTICSTLSTFLDYIVFRF